MKKCLESSAGHTQILRAIAANHQSWFAENAQAEGGETQSLPGATWTLAPDEGVLAFPRLSGATAGVALDTFVAQCRQAGAGSASCWALEPTRPRDLGARLAARGFEWGWKPHWMALNLDALPAELPVPDGLRIIQEDAPDWKVKDLPYYSRPKAPSAPLPFPRRTWHFGAWLEGKIVGHSILHLTTGRQGVAGIYNVGVVPAARGQGIGRAISLAPCRLAHALGCRWATLNAATHIYEKLGFVSLGWGQTWWMHAPTLAAPPPQANEIAFAEAIGRGDVRTLRTLGEKPENWKPENWKPENWDAPLSSGHTPLSLAVRAGKPASARWLVAQGATLDILSAWDLGWQDQVPQLLARYPHLVNRQSGDRQTTPLHEAVERGDSRLLRLLLAANPDLTLQDANFHATALDWASHLGQNDMVALLRTRADVL